MPRFFFLSGNFFFCPAKFFRLSDSCPATLPRVSRRLQSSAKSLISESMSVEISFIYRENNNGPEWSLVGPLTKLEPPPKFHHLQQHVVFYRKERNLST